MRSETSQIIGNLDSDILGVIGWHARIKPCKYFGAICRVDHESLSEVTMQCRVSICLVAFEPEAAKRMLNGPDLREHLDA
ncbi:hypothetical protein BOC55_05120 [Burkholderia pseudomallei]|nr:hypothetical protein BOC47_16445 [Burkholderia pseudomallei]ARL30074.1 hypothetical protein BOC48_12215 [Burkholderia pseudomallei]ARL74305.1 hypothetical protein BOC54_19525 [Burkholderia pseudomallei]ARL78789.1 hypothetical protein BOC55_05120 [Burkholderia pseudomallei]